MKRDPNSPIGVDDYVGTVGNERHAIHQTHFQGVRKDPTHPKDDPNWVYLGVGKWKRKEAVMKDWWMGFLEQNPMRNFPNMTIEFRIPNHLVPESVKEVAKENSNLFYAEIKSANKETEHQSYAYLLRNVAKKFEEWANIIEGYENHE